MTQAIVRETFAFCLQAASQLAIADPLVERLQNALSDVMAYQIGRNGELLEWNENFEESEIHHRHISHLYALHPGR